MDIIELGALGELVGGVGSAVGGIAVLATLAYLAIQVRQSIRGLGSGIRQLLDWNSAQGDIFSMGRSAADQFNGTRV